jgi:hypothetical protein
VLLSGSGTDETSRAVDLDRPRAQHKAGATTCPCPACCKSSSTLPQLFLNAGLAPERIAEGSEPTRFMLAILARKH